MKTKACGNCKTEKPTDQFNKRHGNKDGLHEWCKECNRERGRKFDKARRAEKKLYNAF